MQNRCVSPGVTDPLSAWVIEAQDCVKGTASPTIPPRWIARFKKAVDDLTAELIKPDPATADPKAVDRAVEVLAHIPADEQKGLNARLAECAAQLQVDEFVDLMDRILTELGKVGAEGAATDQLRAGIAPFRILCRALTDLIADHNLCQDVDGALREAAGLAEVTPSALAQWAEVKAALQDIADRRKGDLRADRALASAADFEAGEVAAQNAAKGDDAEALAAVRKRIAKVFERLLERFNDLFFYTDKSLLKVTQDLVSAVQTLVATLRRI